jgi:hypothetical protein
MQSAINYPQTASRETRTAWLKSVVNGTSSGDPVRTVFNSVFEVNPASLNSPPGSVSRWVKLAPGDERLPMLRQLAMRGDRTAAAANLMLYYCSSVDDDRKAAIVRLDALSEKGDSPVGKELPFHLLDIHGLRATAYLQGGNLQEAERHIDRMMALERQLHGDKRGARCLALLRAQSKLLKTVQDNAAAKNDAATVQRANVLREKVEAFSREPAPAL